MHQAAILPSIRPIDILIMRIMTSSLQCRHVLATDFVERICVDSAPFSRALSPPKTHRRYQKENLSPSSSCSSMAKSSKLPYLLSQPPSDCKSCINNGLGFSTNHMTHSVISPNFIPSISCAFSGALSFSLALISSSVTCVKPQSMHDKTALAGRP